MNQNISRFIIGWLLFIFSLSVNASYKIYEAELSESDWLYNGTPLECKLTHKVPLYGDAFFSKQAGKKQALEFKLGYRMQPISAVKVASIQSLSPSWLPRQRPRDLGSIKIHSGKYIFQTTDTASWKILNELEIGRFPTFRYQGFESIQDQVSVSLSAVGFKQPYDKFLDCLNSLVPYKLNELKQMTLRFDFDKHSLKKSYLGKLNALAAYVRFDPNLEVVFINGYTDSKGSRGYNEKLAIKRIASVQKILMQHGAEENKFKTIAFGEKNPVASNRKASGRALNRRVYIKVQ